MEIGFSGVYRSTKRPLAWTVCFNEGGTFKLPIVLVQFSYCILPVFGYFCVPYPGKHKGVKFGFSLGEPLGKGRWSTWIHWARK